MSLKLSTRFVLLIIFYLWIQPLCYAQGNSHAQPATDQLERCLWYNAEKTAKIKIYRSADGIFSGEVVWLKVPDINGKPKVDGHNPDKARQNDPIIGLKLLKNLKKTGDNTYESGTVYDPKNGKTYSCILTYKGDKLDLRGYMGFSFIGRTTTWTRADN